MPNRVRDMSNKQFLAALTRHGMKPTGFMGYVELGNGTNTSVSMLNAGTTNLRAILAYLLKQLEKRKAEMERERAASNRTTPHAFNEEVVGHLEVDGGMQAYYEYPGFIAVPVGKYQLGFGIGEDGWYFTVSELNGNTWEPSDVEGEDIGIPADEADPTAVALGIMKAVMKFDETYCPKAVRA
jgi:hypothetical protein